MKWCFFILKITKLSDMKNGVTIFSIILTLWIVGCTYLYVCVIRKDCCDSSVNYQSNELSEALSIEKETAVTVPETLVIHFMISSTECQLQESELKKISELEKYISHNPEKRLLVIGHSDNTGNDLINTEMSNERAVFMKLKLVEGGIDPDIIEVYSKGSSDPVADNNTATGRLMNRRAETIIK